MNVRVVYVLCLHSHSCNYNARYIGQMCQRLQHRIDKHKRAVRTADFSASALVEHIWNCGHPADWENLAILAHALDLDSPWNQSHLFYQ